MNQLKKNGRRFILFLFVFLFAFVSCKENHPKNSPLETAVSLPTIYSPSEAFQKSKKVKKPIIFLRSSPSVLKFLFSNQDVSSLSSYFVWAIKKTNKKLPNVDFLDFQGDTIVSFALPNDPSQLILEMNEVLSRPVSLKKLQMTTKDSKNFLKDQLHLSYRLARMGHLASALAVVDLLSEEKKIPKRVRQEVLFRQASYRLRLTNQTSRRDSEKMLHETVRFLERYIDDYPSGFHNLESGLLEVRCRGLLGDSSGLATFVAKVFQKFEDPDILETIVRAALAREMSSRFQDPARAILLLHSLKSTKMGGEMKDSLRILEGSILFRFLSSPRLALKVLGKVNLPRSKFLQAEIMMEEGLYPEKAFRLYREVYSKSDVEILRAQALYGEGESKFFSGDFAQSEKIFASIRDTAALTAAKQQDFYYLKRMMKVDPASAYLSWIVAGLRYAKQGRTQEALKAYTKVVDENPRSLLVPEALWLMAQISLNDNPSKARAYLQKIVYHYQTSPPSGPARRLLAKWSR